jgi:hypothetical protein
MSRHRWQNVLFNTFDSTPLTCKPYCSVEPACWVGAANWQAVLTTLPRHPVAINPAPDMSISINDRFEHRLRQSGRGVNRHTSANKHPLRKAPN